uniref:Uncharacterized protein n=1 Tax=Bos indicus x Bos taurus TaxID=30522 RepID=A0A4W2BXX2_BOBOX
MREDPGSIPGSGRSSGEGNAGATWAAGSTVQQTKSASWGVRGTGLTTSGGTQGASAILPRRLTGARSWPCSSTGYESSVFTLHIWGKYTHS